MARGCAGIALTGHLADRFAPLRGHQLADAVITESPDLRDDRHRVRMPPVWSVDAGGGVRWALASGEDGQTLVFLLDDEPALVADLIGRSIRIGPYSPARSAQLIAAVGAPALAAAAGAVPLHGASFALGGEATLVVGPSGSGKSTLLRAFTDAGWHPISEDVTTVDLAPGRPRAWPGPPWVRLAPGEPGPRATTARPDPTDKVSWDLTGRLCDGPMNLARIVLLATPSQPRAGPRLEIVPPEQAISSLAPHVTWVSLMPRADAAFRSAVALSRRVPVMRLELPRRHDWTVLAMEALTAR